MKTGKASAGRWAAVGLLVLAGMAGGGYVLQRQEAAVLRREIGWLREEQEALARLRAENERLKAAQAPAAEVERLRADRAALVRLRGEIDGMRARLDGQENALTQTGAGRADGATGAVRMRFRVGRDGGLETETGAADLGRLREQFKAMAAAKQPAELRLAIGTTDRAALEQVKVTHRRLVEAAKEAGLRFTLELEQPGK